ncbi:hypothetical protein WJX81_006710 [Elliptochloris bilobata]|uniref:G domain-containing protein n=1 Tax=Elliptochloris bilobata TaxID=381761 RepID=A0AAW1QKH0_9CHLO
MSRAPCPVAVYSTSAREPLTSTVTAELPGAPAKCIHRSRAWRHQVCSVAYGQAEALDERWTDQAASEGGRLVQWYPGHIARAERRLREQLALVDVVLEVRDARIPASTAHPSVARWCGAKPRLVLLNRVDMVAERDRDAWAAHFASTRQPVLWTDGASGLGVGRVTKAALRESARINNARARRGLKPRPVRAVVVGFPNVGKSALINRLLSRRLCDSAPRPGVTRTLKWLRIGGLLDLLDSPGIIPGSFSDQRAAQRLAMCNDIGEAAYVDSLVACALLDAMAGLPTGAAIRRRLGVRYGVPWAPSLSSEDYLLTIAADKFQGEPERAGQRLLKDFRTGALGRFALELPPT